MKKGAPMLQLDEDVLDQGRAALSSYEIHSTRSLHLRAFLFTNGTMFDKNGTHQVGVVTASDIDQSTKKSVGQGASGTVYYAHLGDGTPIALKEIRITSKPHRDELDRELTFFSSCYDSSHVVRNLGAYWDAENDVVVIMMEWLSYSLKDLSLFWPLMDEAILRDVYYQVLIGLDYLHSVKKLIHRDIKPSNLLVSRDGFVKIGDFGVSKLCQTYNVVTASYVGTLAYMAPERLEQTAMYSFSSDVWSLGLSVVGCALGRENPWSLSSSEMTVFELLGAIAGGEVPRLPAKYSATARDFVDQCLTRDADARPTCKELLNHPFFAGCSPTTCTESVQFVVLHMSMQLKNDPNSKAFKTPEEMSKDAVQRIDNLLLAASERQQS